jgi:hypothetical protein
MAISLARVREEINYVASREERLDSSVACACRMEEELTPLPLYAYPLRSATSIATYSIGKRSIEGQEIIERRRDRDDIMDRLLAERHCGCSGAIMWLVGGGTWEAAHDT